MIRHSKTQIFSAAELLLYIPLIDKHVLRDVVARLYGNDNPEYLEQEITYLYRSITPGAAKNFCDKVRDCFIRAGFAHDIPPSFFSEEEVEAYEKALTQFLKD